MNTLRKCARRNRDSAMMLAIGVFAFTAFGVMALEPNLQSGVYIQDGGSPLAVETMSAPTVVDWNNNGKKDLVVGQFTSGKIKAFLNQGTDEAPVFNGGFFVQSEGIDITTSYG